MKGASVQGLEVKKEGEEKKGHGKAGEEVNT